jgi:hypothetical protein
MSKIKIIGLIWIILLVATIAPIPLSFIDPTFHWLLLVTLPIGGLLLVLFGVIWIVMKSRQPTKAKQ